MKIIETGLVAITLASTTIMMTNADVVNAKGLPLYNSSYWYKPRKMITTKNQQLWLINGNTIGYKQHPVKKKTLKKGSVVTVRQIASWPWIFTHHIPSIGNANKSNHFWVNMNQSTNWLRKYKK